MIAATFADSCYIPIVILSFWSYDHYTYLNTCILSERNTHAIGKKLNQLSLARPLPSRDRWRGAQLGAVDGKQGAWQLVRIDGVCCELIIAEYLLFGLPPSLLLFEWQVFSKPVFQYPHINTVDAGGCMATIRLYLPFPRSTGRTAYPVIQIEWKHSPKELLLSIHYATFFRLAIPVKPISHVFNIMLKPEN